MLLAHLSDLHLRDENDVVEFGRQLDCIVARQADHLVISGDLLDRWHPPLLDWALDALAARSLLHPQRLTLIHGNHDLASSGGYPRTRRDLWRLALRFWDPPPLIRRRREQFYTRVAARAPDLGQHPPFTKSVHGLRFAAIDSVPAPWLPLTFAPRHITLQHAAGAIALNQTAWLESQAGPQPVVVVMHHYPGEAGSFRWRDTAGSAVSGRMAWARSWTFEVPMDVAREDRTRFWMAAERAGAVAVLCGHVHRARLEQHGRIAVGLNGQSGAHWAGRTIAFYRLEGAAPMTAEYVTMPASGGALV